MSKTIVQKIVFKNTKPEDLYDLYMDSKKHSIATAAPAKLSGKEGGAYSAHGGYMTGKNLRLIKNQLIAQTWRASNWDKSEPDSIFLIQLEPKGNDTILNMVHSGVPDKEAASLEDGWHTYYWTPWKSYLKGKPITKYPEM